MKEKVLRDTHIRSMHDMGEIKRAQELRVDEVSVQKSRENHDTILNLTFKLHEMQEQMNSMNDSGEFHEVESKNSGRMSHVSSQLAMIPSSRSVLSRDKRLPLDTWNQAGLQENVFGTQFSMFDSPRDQENENQFHKLQGRTLLARDDKQNQGTIPMLTFATRPVDYDVITTGASSAEFYGWTRNCNSTDSLIDNHSWFGRYDSKIM